MDNLELKAWVGNLGKYNEGELKGEWVDLPISKDELKEVLDRIDVGKEIDGVKYEEYFIGDYDGNIPAGIELSEYESFDSLNTLAEVFDQVNKNGDQKAFEALCDDVLTDWKDAAVAYLEHQFDAYEGNTVSDLGHGIIDEFGGVEAIDESMLCFINYDEIGRDIDNDYAPENEGDPETAAEYYCGDENASFEDIAKTVYPELAGDNWDLTGKEDFLKNYFDYEAFGDDVCCCNSVVFGDDVIVVIQDEAKCDRTLEDVKDSLAEYSEQSLDNLITDAESKVQPEKENKETKSRDEMEL